MKSLLIYILLSFWATSLMAQTPYVVLPERFKNNPILIENSEEYKNLIKTNESLARQIDDEKRKYAIFSKSVDEQVIKNSDIQSKLLKDFNQAQVTIAKKEAAIYKRNLTIVSLSITITIMIVGFIAALYFGVIRFGGIPRIF